MGGKNMKCHYCGAEVAEGQEYCLWCGTRQEPEANLPPEEVSAEYTDIWMEPAAEPEQMPEQPVLQELPAVQPSQPENVPSVEKCLPRLQLPTRRGLGKMIFLGILTLGIYPVVIWSRIVTELNLAASRYDGKRTMPYFAMVMLTPFTLGIFAFVWMHRFCRRIGDELQRRGIGYKFGPATFWLWNILGSLIIVGPFVFAHKLMKSMNKINADFNING